MKTKQAIHTPGPWKLQGSEIVAPYTWIASVGTFTDSGTDSDEACKANAALIVKAVNLHEELVNTLKDIAEEAEKCFSEISDISAAGRMARLRFKKLAKMADKVLAKAEGRLK